MKSKLTIGTIATCLLLLSSCKNVNKQVTHATLTPAHTYETTLGMPISMQYADHVLVVADLQGTEGMVYLLDAQTGKPISHVAPKGNGNDEVVEVPIAEVTKDQGKEKIRLYDLVKKKLLVYDMAEACKGGKVTPEVIKMKSDGRYYGVNRLEKGYAALGLFEDKKFELLDDSLATVAQYGDYLQPVTPNKQKMVNAMANYGRSAVSPDKSLLVNISFAAGVVRLYDVKGNTLKHKKDAVVKPLNYKVKGADYKNLEGMGFLALAISDKYVYALYSGEKEDFKSPMPMGSHVYRYDYDGELDAVYELSSPSFTLAVSDDDKQLYAITDQKGYSILVYNLK